MAGSQKVLLDRVKMANALDALDAEMGRNPMVYAFSPITMVSPGGFLAVTYFENRSSTEDIDVIIDPEYASDKDIVTAIRSAMTNVGNAMGIGEDWITEHVAMFLTRESRESIFKEATDQDLVLWQGDNLKVLAAPLKFGLESKLRRITNEPHHPKAVTDVHDLLEILSRMTDQGGGPLDRAAVQALNRNGFDAPISNQAVDRVAVAYRAKYGTEAFC